MPSRRPASFVQGTRPCEHPRTVKGRGGGKTFPILLLSAEKDAHAMLCELHFPVLNEAVSCLLVMHMWGNQHGHLSQINSSTFWGGGASMVQMMKESWREPCPPLGSWHCGSMAPSSSPGAGYSVGAAWRTQIPALSQTLPSLPFVSAHSAAA